jgi:hypothetical protein
MQFYAKPCRAQKYKPENVLDRACWEVFKVSLPLSLFKKCFIGTRNSSSPRNKSTPYSKFKPVIGTNVPKISKNVFIFHNNLWWTFL